jgi:uncharacterized protein
MQPFIVNLHPQLIASGQVLSLAGTLDEAEYRVGLDTYSLEHGIDYDVVLTNIGDAILLTGMARATTLGECARCLSPVYLELAGEVEGYYLINQTDCPRDDLAEDEFEYVLPDETVDIAPAILAALIIETPIMILCDEDCRGLCPKCGADLNEGLCGCEGDAAVAKGDANPFAVLKDLNLE